MSIIDKAHEDAKRAASILTADGMWGSGEMDSLSLDDREAVLDIYRQYFKAVDYSADTGICICQGAIGAAGKFSVVFGNR